jgi:hypothetical protein
MLAVCSTLLIALAWRTAILSTVVREIEASA